MPLAAFNRFRARARDRARRRWQEPIGGAGRRAAAWASLLLFDHGVLRPVYWNSGRVTPELWRGAQPNPFHLARLARRGLKTVVNLRGPTEYGSYALAREAAGRLGLAFENAVVWSRSAPRREDIHALRELFDRIEYPALLHCKSGADRSGLAAALYLVLRENRPVEEAKRQLSLRWGHVRAARTGVLDAFFDAYLAANAARPIAFLDWIDTAYDREALERSFRSSRWGDVLIDRLLRRE
jgi:protein tyrosine/serine phosphatase